MSCPRCRLDKVVKSYFCRDIKVEIDLTHFFEAFQFLQSLYFARPEEIEIVPKSAFDIENCNEASSFATQCGPHYLEHDS